MTTASVFQPILASQTGRALYWQQLYGCSASLCLSHAAHQHAGPLLLIAGNPAIASQLECELRLFVDKTLSIPLLHFPDWETLPFDPFSPHHDIISERLKILYQAPQLKKGIIIACANSLMQRLAPREHLAGSFILNQGDTLNPNLLRERLQQYNYHSVSQVIQQGEFAIRGSIMDIFPSGSNTPFRLDLLDNEIDSIKSFDIDSQLSKTPLKYINLLPAREYPLNQNSITQFRQNWRSRFSGNPSNVPLYQSISQGENAPGIEYYLPLFFNKTESFFDYLPKNTLIITINSPKQSLLEILEQNWQEINTRYEQYRYDTSRPLLEPKEVFIAPNQLLAEIKNFAHIKIENKPTNNTQAVYYNTEMLPNLNIDNTSTQPLFKLENFIESYRNRILFCSESAGRQQALIELLARINIKPTIYTHWLDFLKDEQNLHGIIIAPLDQGLYLPNLKISMITESLLLGEQVMQRRRRKLRTNNNELLISNLVELSKGDPVVHIQKGIGRYCGLQVIKTGDQEAEYITLEYAGSSKLYVPVSSLHLISRYSDGDAEHAPLSQLGNKKWQKDKQKALESIRDIAAELLLSYAKREAKLGYSFKKPDQDYALFASSFPFEETPDQMTAIEAVLEDMSKPKPMDRLVCGDVGFGKTEVAMRAAFVACQDHKQVLVLVPTTLLAMQHFNNFKDRFADWPIKIDMLSRFRSQADQTQIIKEIQDGKIDIIIGTHKLLQKTIEFKDLGLLIVDEEHRFGVSQKEHIKNLRSDIDILTLTATPIPRTLNMALNQLRDLSIIATPPAHRLSIKTFIMEYGAAIIREAIQRETHRGGQVYFLHNEVQTINNQALYLMELVPEARISIAHGQMHERELEKIMADFYHQRFNVLICTTIIESGIDIPTANTIIINKADHFGLSQLHQLRGRVGRSQRQAYAYLLAPPRKSLTRDAQKRFEALESSQELGTGFILATNDLEIRGAGELLGSEQSGNMHTLGFSLYRELLQQAIETLKQGKEPLLDQLEQKNAIEINLHIPALIPESYIGDVHGRLLLYKRIASAKNSQDLDELQVEFIDRFCPLPLATQNLFQITYFKLQAMSIGIIKIEAGNNTATIEFGEQFTIDPAKIIELVQTKPEQYQLAGSSKLRVIISEPSAETRIRNIKALLNLLLNC